MATRRSKAAQGKKRPGKSRESLEKRKARAARILALLREIYPGATCFLDHRSALELLVATILAAQATDAAVNKVTPVLFAKYPGAKALAGAEPADIEREIHSLGFFRQKAKSIQGACRRIVEAYGGEVPDSMDDLVTLPGVARKTANVVLGTWFRKNEGIVVDTHVGRLAHRMGLTWTSRDEKDAVKIEGDLLQLIPREDWTFFGHALTTHGRKTCTARKPDCAGCRIAKLCPSAFRCD